MKEILKYLWERRTTILGDLVTVLGVLSTATDVFGEQTIRIMVLTVGVLTSLLGRYNNMQIKKEKANDSNAPT